jgi:hypothetical protein
MRSSVPSRSSSRARRALAQAAPRRWSRRTCGSARSARPGARRPRPGGRVGPGRGVGRHVGGDVGEQVAHLGQPVGQLGQPRVVVADPCSSALGAGSPAPWRVGRRRPRSDGAPRGGLGGPRRVSACRAGSSSAASAASSPGCGSTASISSSPNRSRSASGPARGRGPRQLGQLGSVARSSVVQPSGSGQRLGDRAPAKRSSASRCGSACSSRCWSDWPCTATRTRPARPARDRHRGAADEGAGAPLGRDVAGQRTSGRPRARRRSPRPRRRRPSGRPAARRPRPARALAPVRTAPVSARPPSSSPSAVTTIVLPAPVSPVMTVRPGRARARRRR